jgi:hypothetical protein
MTWVVVVLAFCLGWTLAWIARRGEYGLLACWSLRRGVLLWLVETQIDGARDESDHPRGRRDRGRVWLLQSVRR